jgi:hypothetical protein
MTATPTPPAIGEPLPREATLLPCPFCGGDDVKTHVPYGWSRQWCISHSCPTFYSGTSEFAQGFPTEASAITAWNARTPAQPTAPRAESLSRIRKALRLLHRTLLVEEPNKRGPRHNTCADAFDAVFELECQLGRAK